MYTPHWSNQIRVVFFPPPLFPMAFVPTVVQDHDKLWCRASRVDRMLVVAEVDDDIDGFKAVIQTEPWRNSAEEHTIAG